jgi:hypothetical protein
VVHLGFEVRVEVRLDPDPHEGEVDDKALFVWAQLDRDAARALGLGKGDRVHVVGAEAQPTNGTSAPKAGTPVATLP